MPPAPEFPIGSKYLAASRIYIFTTSAAKATENSCSFVSSGPKNMFFGSFQPQGPAEYITWTSKYVQLSIYKFISSCCINPQKENSPDVHFRSQLNALPEFLIGSKYLAAGRTYIFLQPKLQNPYPWSVLCPAAYLQINQSLKQLYLCQFWSKNFFFGSFQLQGPAEYITWTSKYVRPSIYKFIINIHPAAALILKKKIHRMCISGPN